MVRRLMFRGEVVDVLGIVEEKLYQIELGAQPQQEDRIRGI